MNMIWLAFITGLTTGGISCLAVQGGLLTSAVADQKEKQQKASIFYFLVSKTVAYTLLGALLGIAGAALTLTPKTQGWMQIFAGIVMLTTAARLLKVHPIFDKFVITPPKSFYRLVRNSSKMDSYFAPSVLGFATVLIPCGVTQSMMILAIASGSAFWGAMIMLFFTLGTTPVFFTLGIASKVFLSNKKLSYAAAAVIFVLAVSAFNTGQILRGSVHTLQNYNMALTQGQKTTQEGLIAGINVSGKQEAEIEVITGGYRSEHTTLKAGVPVSLKLTTNDTKGCSRAFTIPEYNISEILPETGEVMVEFTPTKTGMLTYTCSMGMYTGYFQVI